MTTRESRKSWITYALAMGWLFLLLWPLLGIRPDGLVFGATLEVWGKIAAACAVILALVQLNRAGHLDFVASPARRAAAKVQSLYAASPKWIFLTVLLAVAILYPFITSRYGQDVAINVLVYVCLGLGLNIVIGLCGLLDLGYIAFYGVGAYTYALLSVHYGISFWVALPFAAFFASIAGCIIGYPTLRMRGDYLAIVTLGFGEIVRLILNNWMTLTNGPNGILGIKAPGAWVPDFAQGFSLEHVWLSSPKELYYVILLLAVITIISVYRLNYSRIGRAWEAIREDETAAELMGVNTFKLKLLAYAMGAVFGGLAGAFFSSKMRFVSPESFTFLESAMVLAMVVLGGLGSIPGVFLGVLALIALPEVFREFELYRMLVFGGAMTFMMVVKPKGFWPAKRFGKRSEED
ncbi:MAG: ABC transporter permease subunit [Desulfovibrionaceae bacterium]